MAATTESAHQRRRHSQRTRTSRPAVHSPPPTLKGHAVDKRAQSEHIDVGTTTDTTLKTIEGVNMIPHILQVGQTQPPPSRASKQSTMANPPLTGHTSSLSPPSTRHSLSPIVCSDSRSRRLTGPPMSLPTATISVSKTDILRHLGVASSIFPASTTPAASLPTASAPSNPRGPGNGMGSADTRLQHRPPPHGRRGVTRIDVDVHTAPSNNINAASPASVSDSSMTENGSTAQTSPVTSFSRTTSNSSTQLQSQEVSITQKIEQLAREIDALGRPERQQLQPAANLASTSSPSTTSHKDKSRSSLLAPGPSNKESTAASVSSVPALSSQMQNNQDTPSRNTPSSSSVRRDQVSSQERRNPASPSPSLQKTQLATSSLKPAAFLDYPVPNRNVCARFSGGLEAQLVTTPFEPTHLTVIGIPIDLVISLDKSGGDASQRARGHGRNELKPTPRDQSRIGAQVDHAKRVMREVLESFGVVTNVEFRCVGEFRRTGDENLQSSSREIRHVDEAPAPLPRVNGGNSRNGGRPSVFTVVPSSPTSSAIDSEKRIGKGDGGQGKAHGIGPGRVVGAAGNSVKTASHEDNDRRTTARLAQRSSTAVRPTRSTHLARITETNNDQSAESSSARPTEVIIAEPPRDDSAATKKADANSKVELVANVQYAHHTEALSALRALNAGGQLTIADKSTAVSPRSIVMPSTLSATFSRPLAPDQPSSNMVSDTVFIRWEIPVPKLRLYYRDNRVARREVEIINTRTFFGRRLFARFLGRSKNVVVVEGVRHCHVLKTPKELPPKVKSAASQGEPDEERRIFEGELKELEKRHQPDGGATLFDDYYDHDQAMAFIRELFRGEQERARTHEEQGRALVGWGESAPTAVNATLKAGLRYHDIRETLPNMTVEGTNPSTGSAPEATREMKGGSVAVVAHFHSSVAASNFYTHFQTAITDLPWRASARLISILSQDLLYVMKYERLVVLEPQIDELRTRLATARLRLQISIPQGQHAYRYVRISGAPNLRSFKPMIDALLVGEVIMSPEADSTKSQPLWDGELELLYNLDKIIEGALLPPQTQVLVEPNRKRLLVFGPSPARRKTAIERILKRFDEVKRRLMTIEFDRCLLKYYAHAADNQLAPAFGQANVWLDAAACKISVAGGGAVTALKEVQKRAPRPDALLELLLRGDDDGARRGAEETTRCPVCLERAICPVEGLMCEHSYCDSCLRRYLVCATQAGPGASFPLRCFGTVVVQSERIEAELPPKVVSPEKGKGRRGRQQPRRAKEINPVDTTPKSSTLQQDVRSATKPCEKPIPLEVIQRLLTPEQFETAMNRSFESYTNSRPNEFRHCPTSDCPEIFRVLKPADDGSQNGNNAWTSTLAQHCPSCLVKLCPICFAQGGHDGQSCAQYKKEQQRALEEEARQVEQLVRSFGGRTCPKCRMGLLKDGGCAHVRCSRCGVHICWTCGKTFEEVDKESVYEHMTRVHGSIGLVDWGAAGAVEDDDDGWQLAIMMNDAQEQDNTARRDLRHGHGLGSGDGEQSEEPRSTLASSGSSRGSTTAAPTHTGNGKRASTSGTNHGQAASTNNTSPRRHRGKQRFSRHPGPRRTQYDNKEEFSEDENDDFGVADWDYDYADVNWEAL